MEEIRDRGETIREEQEDKKGGWNEGKKDEMEEDEEKQEQKGENKERL